MVLRLDIVIIAVCGVTRRRHIVDEHIPPDKREARPAYPMDYN